MNKTQICFLHSDYYFFFILRSRIRLNIFIYHVFYQFCLLRYAPFIVDFREFETHEDESVDNPSD